MKEIEKPLIESFLTEFKVKTETFDIFFEKREKNLQTLLDLEITPAQRKEYIKKLRAEDNISGPNEDTNDKTRMPYWEFGMRIKNKDIYIKISLNKKNKSTLCISFHIAEFPLKYKFN